MALKPITIHLSDVKAQKPFQDSRIVSWQPKTNTLFFTCNDQLHKATVLPSKTNPQSYSVILHTKQGSSFTIDFSSKLSEPIQRIAHNQASIAICAPLAGRIISCNIAPGDVVKQHQRLLSIESMKMENELRAQADGIVEEVSIKINDIVSTGQHLVIINPAEK